MQVYKLLTTIILLFTLGLSVSGQNTPTEEINVPLSNPGQAGTLIANSHRGQITVKGYNGSEVQVALFPDNDDYDDDDHWDNGKKKKGLKKIAGGMSNVEITEENNVVKVSTGNNKEINLVISVPNNFSLKIGTHHDGDVQISNIIGTVEVDAHHGDVSLENITGSANVNTHHGEIMATFDGIDSSTPMAFTTYHGDVDITFPASVKCNTKMKTSKGDIYTDFDMNVSAQPAEKQKSKGGKTKIKLGGWMHGAIGSGGQEYMFSTYHGDVIIRKA